MLALFKSYNLIIQYTETLLKLITIYFYHISEPNRITFQLIFKAKIQFSDQCDKFFLHNFISAITGCIRVTHVLAFRL